MTLEEFMFGDPMPVLISSGQACTRTYRVNRPSKHLMEAFDIPRLIRSLNNLNALTEGIRQEDRHSFYHSFKMLKRSGGYRRIDAPNEMLMSYQRMLKMILEDEFQALYHSSAFAYVKKRCNVDSIKRHQINQSKWFAKFDFSNFFGSTTKEFVMHMLSMVFPFSEVMRTEEGYKALDTALDLAFLDGVLPQGTPLSPLLTNVMMIPIDFALANGFRNFEKNQFVYTRYADDLLVSSKYDFDFHKVEAKINETLADFQAPFKIKAEKTRYGSSAGRNWNLGVMLNEDNEITVGNKKKREFKAALSNYILDHKKGILWDKSDVMTLEGYRNYYTMVEGSTITEIVNSIGKKYGVDVRAMIKEDLRS